MRWSPPWFRWSSSPVLLSRVGVRSVLVGVGCEDVESEGSGEEARGSLAAHAVARAVEARREDADAALAGRGRDDAARDPRLAGEPDLEQTLPRAVVQSGGCQHRGGVARNRWRDDTLTGDGVHAAVGERRPHDGEIGRAHE